MTLGANKTIDVVCHWDPALDMTREQLEVYVTGRDVKLLRVLPGAKPTRYVVKQMTRAMMRRCDEAQDVMRLMRSFAYAVVSVHDLIDDDGNVTPRLEPTGKAFINGTEHAVWSEDDLERIPHAALAEIGGVAYAHGSFLPGIARAYPLLLSSALVSGAVERRLAEKTLRDALVSNENPTAAPAEAALEPKPRAPSGDAPTAAIATG